jgi:hypothetical protein
MANAYKRLKYVLFGRPLPSERLDDLLDDEQPLAPQIEEAVAATEAGSGRVEAA